MKLFISNKKRKELKKSIVSKINKEEAYLIIREYIEIMLLLFGMMILIGLYFNFTN